MVLVHGGKWALMVKKNGLVVLLYKYVQKLIEGPGEEFEEEEVFNE